MSRSRKKHPWSGNTTAPSEREDKQMWHRSFRRKNKALTKSPNAEETVFPISKEASDPWAMAKDGKGLWTDDQPYKTKVMRK